MKKIMCCDDGRIYEGTALKDGTISKTNRIDMTDDCIIATTQHLSCYKTFLEYGMSGCKWRYDNDGGEIRLVLYDTSKYKFTKIGD